MKKIFTLGLIVIVLSPLFVGMAYSQSLEEIKAKARAEVREEMGLTNTIAAPVAQKVVQKKEVTPMSDTQKIVLLRKLTLFMMILALIPAAIARSKGRSFIAWWILGLICIIVTLPASLWIKKVTYRIVG